MSEYNHIDIEDKVVTLKGCDRVINVFCKGEKVVISEACDDWFSVEYSKDEAIAMFEEIVGAIRKGDLL